METAFRKIGGFFVDFFEAISCFPLQSFHF